MTPGEGETAAPERGERGGICCHPAAIGTWLSLSTRGQMSVVHTRGQGASSTDLALGVLTFPQK